MKYLGCELPYFLEYLRLQFFDDMSFDERTKWELDHIRPLTSFDLEDDSVWSCCWNWRNLRPIPKAANRKKRENSFPGKALIFLNFLHPNQPRKIQLNSKTGSNK